jgi:transcriptional regulator with XRE-family HTH domain
MGHTSHIVKESASPNLHAFGKEFAFASAHNVSMARNYLKAWREFREMSQEHLAEKVGTTGSVISMLESGNRGLSDKWLRKLAPVLETSPGMLLDHDPEDLPTDIIDIWSHIPDQDKATARRVLEGFRRTGTDD